LAGLWIWHRPQPLFAAAKDQPAQYLSSYTWSLPDDWFGGFSGIEVSDDGSAFVAISDRGQITTGTFQRDRGEISAITLATHNLLRDDKNIPTVQPRTDAEGLAVGSDGRLHISFERVDRVWTYDTPDGIATWASYHLGWRALNTNGGLEALAVSPDDVLWAIAETTGRGAEVSLVYSRAPGQKWSQVFVVDLDDDFSPVGADFGPDGRLYLLERGLYPFGFRSRVRALTLGSNGIGSYETLMQSRIGQHDNLEGLSVWTDDAGRTRLTMISDDNFMAFQKTEIVEYVLR
jgi:hypothetical protein